MSIALSDKQQVFVEAYLTTWNATEAARQAEYAKPGQQGHRLLKNVEIAEEIQRRIADKAMTADEVLVRLSEQARNEHGKYITSTGIVNLPQLIADGKGHLIKGIKETQYGKNVEFYDAQAALVHIGKHHGLFRDKVDVEHSGNVKVENVSQLSDDERSARVAAILDAARERRDRPAPGEQSP